MTYFLLFLSVSFIVFLVFGRDVLFTIKVIEMEDYNHIFVLNIFGTIVKSYLYLEYEDYDEIREMLYMTMPRAKVVYA